MHGNVFEWCKDWFVQYAEEFSTVASGDGYRTGSEVTQAIFKILRGGSFKHGPLRARVSSRFYEHPRDIEYFMGVRPARSLDNAE